MLCISLVVLLLLGILLWQGNALEQELAAYQEQERVLSRKVEEEKARTQEIDGQKEYMQTDEYVEEAARDRRGLVKDNEIIFREAEEYSLPQGRLSDTCCE